LSESLGRLKDLVQGTEGRDLLDAYKKLKVLPTAPDFKTIGALPELPAYFPSIEKIPVSGLIVEMRAHWNLMHVVQRIMRILKIPVTLVHGSENRDFILGSRFVQKQVAKGRLHLVELSLKNVNRAQYNALFLTENLWRSVIPARQILVFQTDATVCPRSPYGLGTFQDVDYVGSFMRNPRPTRLHIDGGNGGLSLRNYARTIEAIRAGVPEAWPGGEDDYFGAHIELLGGTVADENTSKRFSSQTVFEYKSFGVHNPGGLARRDFVRLVAYCPDAFRCHRREIFGKPAEFYFSLLPGS